MQYPERPCFAIESQDLAASSYTAVNRYLVNVAFAGMTRMNCGTEAQKSEYLPRLLDGGFRFALP